MFAFELHNTTTHFIIIHLLAQHVPFSRMHKKPISFVCLCVHERASVSVRIKMILQPNRRITSITLLHYYCLRMEIAATHSHSFAVCCACRKRRAHVCAVHATRMNKKFECECECSMNIERILTLIVYRRIQHHQRQFPFTFVARFSVLRHVRRTAGGLQAAHKISRVVYIVICYIFTVHHSLFTHFQFNWRHTQYYLRTHTHSHTPTLLLAFYSLPPICFNVWWRKWDILKLVSLRLAMHTGYSCEARKNSRFFCNSAVPCT